MISNPGLATSLLNDFSSGTINNWNIGTLTPVTTLEWNGGADATISGLAGGRKGYVFIFKSISSFVAYFLHASGSSSNPNRFENLITSGPTPVAAEGTITFVHDGTIWQLISHEQGLNIKIPFNAGNFTASGAMTWTVASGDVIANEFNIRGRSLQYILNVGGGTTGGVADIELRSTIPYLWNITNSIPMQVFSPGSPSTVISLGGPVNSQSYVRAFSTIGGAAWGLGAGTIFRGSWTFPIQ